MSIGDYIKKSAESAKEMAEVIADHAEDALEKLGDAAENLKDKAEESLFRESHLTRASDIYEMISEGNLLDAFEKYYSDDVVMIEANGDTTEGKAANRTRIQQFLDNVAEVHGSGVEAITSNEKRGITMIESWTDMTFKDGNRIKMEEVAVQQWEDGQVIRERFYYTLPG